MSKVPGILIEAGFMSNPKELKKISEDRYLKDLASDISQGIKDYLALKPKRDVSLF